MFRLALLLCVCTMGVFAPACGPGRAKDLIVHEWGTFSTFSMADGKPLPFQPKNEELPSFVYREKGTIDPILVSMETPVIYFYHPKSCQVRVEVDFPEGRFSDYYPKAELTRRTLSWPEVYLQPGDNRVVDADNKDDNHYFAARATDAVPLAVHVDKDKIEREKFLFYRGIGNFTLPVKFEALGKNRFSVTNDGRETMRGILLVRIDGDRVEMTEVGDLETGTSTKFNASTKTTSVEELQATFVKHLKAAGLYEKEATAMVETWKRAWFRESGLRFFYLLGENKTNELLPLRITPEPAQTVRVLVARHDLLTPEMESACVAELKAKADPVALARLGRFRDPVEEKLRKRLNMDYVMAKADKPSETTFLRESIIDYLNTQGAPRELIGELAEGRFYVKKCNVCIITQKAFAEYSRIKEAPIGKGWSDDRTKKLRSKNKDELKSAVRDLLDACVAHGYTARKFSDEDRKAMEKALKKAGEEMAPVYDYCPCCKGAAQSR